MQTPIVIDECPCCGSARTVPFGTKSGFHFQKCSVCNYVFVTPRPDAEDLVAHYEAAGGHGKNSILTTEEVLRHERDFPNSTLDAKRITAKVREITTARSSMLDIGSAYGFFVREAQAAGFQQVDALEFDPSARAISIDISGVEPIPDSFEEFEPSRKYDYILMSQVLEHAADVRAWMIKSRTLISDDGVLVVAVPNFGGWIARFLRMRDPFVIPPDHLNYFGATSLESLARTTGFEVVAMETQSRLRPDVASRRLGFGGPVKTLTDTLIGALANVSLRALDRSNKGMFLNCYLKPRKGFEGVA